MLPFSFPVILIFLLPVVAIETAYIRLKLRSEWRATINATAKANAVSLLLGFPLAWVVFLVFEIAFYALLMFSGLEDHIRWPFGHGFTDFLIVVTSAAWMGPVNEKWAVPVAFVVLLVPSFLLSGYVESHLVSKSGLGPQRHCRRVVWQANVLSYIFLAIVGALVLGKVVERL